MNSKIITKGLSIALISAVNYFHIFSVSAQDVSCSNYWINPNTGETECFSTFSQPKKSTPSRQAVSESSEPETTSSSKSKVSDVLGLKIEQAKQKLEEQGFKVKVIEKVEEDIPVGQIIKQQPRSGTLFSQGKVVKLTVSKEPVYTIEGYLTLTDTDRVKLLGRTCHGTADYDDISGSLPVTVKDQLGNIIATGSTSGGFYNSNSSFRYQSVGCVFKFKVGAVPKANFYMIEVGNRDGHLNYSFEQMKQKKWKVSLVLGN